MSQDLDLYDVVDGDLLDDTGVCQMDGSPACPGGPAQFQADPYDSDYGNTHRLTYLHGCCAALRAQDV